MTAWRQLLIVFVKEVKDALRDRRAIMTILLSAGLGPVLMGFMFNRVAERQRQLDEVTIPVVGAEHAPAFVDWLRRQSGVTVEDGPADPETEVRESRQDVVVVIPEDFQKDFRASRPVNVKLVLDGSRSSARPKITRVRSLIQRYSAEIGTLRLVSRGVSPAIATPLRVEDVEVSSAQQRAAMILGFIPMFILMAAFAGGMQIAADSTAGERERGSLEPLLVNPAPRHALATGKWLASTFTSMLTVMLTAGLVVAMLRFIPMQEFGVRFRLGTEQIGLLLAAALPMSLLASAAQTYLSTFARSFKEAQSYMGILVIVPMLPGMMATLYPMSGQPWMYPVPILAQQVLSGDALAGRPTPMWAFAAAALSALVIALVLVILTSRLLQRERIIFTR